MKRLLLILSLGLLCGFTLTACFDDGTEAEFGIDALPPDGDSTRGENIFNKGTDKAPACNTCHTTNGENKPTGPTLQGFADVAASRVEGETAREYALNSIIAPGKHLVKGYDNQMFASYDDKLSKQEIADVIAYLLGLQK